MRHSIVSFFNAPITNKVPSYVCSLQALHGYIVNDSQLAGKTGHVRAELADPKRFRRVKQHMLPYVTPQACSPIAANRTFCCPAATL